MELRAHVLLQVDPGWSQEAAAYVASLPFVSQAAATEGPYDVIATLQAHSEAGLDGTVALARRAPGLCALRLCRSTGFGGGAHDVAGVTRAAAP